MDNVSDNELQLNIIAANATNNMERMLTRTLIELTRSGHITFLLLSDDNIGKWWGNKLSKSQKLIDTYRHNIQQYNLKKSAYELLTPTERKLLGITSPVKPKKPKGYTAE